MYRLMLQLSLNGSSVIISFEIALCARHAAAFGVQCAKFRVINYDSISAQRYGVGTRYDHVIYMYAKMSNNCNTRMSKGT